jgi:transcriptional regulator with XRE-family HTH domain
VPRRRDQPAPPRAAEIDLNQVVAYNIRAARDLRGWTQDELADRLETLLGQRPTQASVSALERAFDGERRREFDAHEILTFAMVFDLPILWFFLPPSGDQRNMRGTTRPIGELLTWLLGRPDQLEPLYQRLREYGIDEPTASDEIVERLTGEPSAARQTSYKERRKELLLALAGQHADRFDTAIDELGHVVDHLRQVGLRGFLAETTNDDDLTQTSTDDTAPAGTKRQAKPVSRTPRSRK